MTSACRKKKFYESFSTLQQYNSEYTELLIKYELGVWRWGVVCVEREKTQQRLLLGNPGSH